VFAASRIRKAVYVGKTQKNLVKRLKELRKIHGITQEQFSERTGISYKYYQAVETGVKKELRISTLERFADAYGIEVWELLGPVVPKTRFPKNTKRLSILLKQ
jgi:transcriptional regulator with XRE-family HTH domain